MAEACPAYPWQQDGSQSGQKIFMSGGDCASCHQGMFREPAAAARGELPGVLQAAEVVFAVAEETLPAAVVTPRGAAYTPDLATLATKIQEGRLKNNVYLTGGPVAAASMPRMLAEGVLAYQELKKKMPLQFARSYMGASMAA